MSRIVRLTERDLTHIVKRVIKEEKGESLEMEARIILNRLGYGMTGLKDYTKKELAKLLRKENKERSNVHDKWEDIAKKLDN